MLHPPQHIKIVCWNMVISSGCPPTGFPPALPTDLSKGWVYRDLFLPMILLPTITKWTRVAHLQVVSDLFSSVQFSCSVMSDSSHPQELQYTRLHCLSPTPGVCSNSCPLSQWCHPTISSSVVPFSSCLQSFPGSGSFLSVLCIRWPKYSGFSISPSNKYSGMISFRIDWFDLLAI